MNDLNSILIEGTLTGDPKTTANSCSFEIEFERNNRGIKELSYITIICYDELADKCIKHLKKGTNARAVGRLYAPDRKVGVVADHIEFRLIRGSEEV